MNINRFIALVTDMRRAQRDFYRTRGNSFLMLAKSLERQVDAAIADYQAAAPAPAPTQPDLFDEVPPC